MAIVSSYCKMDCYLKALQIKLFVQKCIHINNGTQNNILNKDTGIENWTENQRVHRRTGICTALPSHKKKIKKELTLCFWFSRQLLACLVSRISFPIFEVFFSNFKLKQLWNIWSKILIFMNIGDSHREIICELFILHKCWLGLGKT